MINVIGGIVCIGVGIFVLYTVVKHPIPKEKDYIAGNLKGYGGGIGIIIIGLVLILKGL